MITLGDVGTGGLQPPNRAACEMIAAALATATMAPWRLGVRLDHAGVIVRGFVEAETASSLAASLLDLPALADAAFAVIERWRGEDLHLITARWDERTRGRWALDAAHGFKGDKWVRPLRSDAGPDVAT
jgi:hypothetical protein